jgi:hypothetical protein
MLDPSLSIIIRIIFSKLKTFLVTKASNHLEYIIYECKIINIKIFKISIHRIFKNLVFKMFFCIFNHEII